jgi:serine/threonine-protein kinase
MIPAHPGVPASLDDDETIMSLQARSTEPAPPPKPKRPVTGFGSAGIAEDFGNPELPGIPAESFFSKLPSQFGAFRLGEPIGTGGMAEVRIGRQTLEDGSSRPCVVKRIAANYTRDPRYREMFIEEMRISTLLDHPNIVKTLDSSESDPLYIAFELIDGVNLADLRRLADKPLPVAVVVEVGIAVARALAYAHVLEHPSGQALNLVHRDVSPQNILISRQGVVKLLDFGIARFEGRQHETAAGEVKGKMRYMAPEQLAEDELDARADLFALSIVLAEQLGALQDGLTLQFTSGIRAERGALPEKLHDLLRKMAAPDRESRPSSAEEVAAELEEIAATIKPRISLAEFGSKEVFPKKRAPTLVASVPPPAAPASREPEGEELGYADTIVRSGPAPSPAPVRVSSRPRSSSASRAAIPRAASGGAVPARAPSGPAVRAPSGPRVSKDANVVAHSVGIPAVSISAPHAAPMSPPMMAQSGIVGPPAESGSPSWLIWTLAAVLTLAALGLLLVILIRA